MTTIKRPCPRYLDWHCPGDPCTLPCSADPTAKLRWPNLEVPQRVPHRSDQDQRGRMTTEDLETIRPVMDAFERATPMYSPTQVKNADTIWNAAIEAAAKSVDNSETNLTKMIAEDIRRLKR